MCQLGTVAHTYNPTLRRGHPGYRVRPGLKEQNRGWREGSAVKKGEAHNQNSKQAGQFIKILFHQVRTGPKKSSQGNSLSMEVHLNLLLKRGLWG